MNPAQRHRKIILLLRSRNDPYPSPPALRLASQPGPAPTGKVPCGCARIRDIRVNHVPVKTIVGDPYCLLCDGTGFRPPISQLDKPNEDADDQGRVYDPYTLGADRADKTRALLQDPAKPKDAPSDDRYPWEKRPVAFRHLERALDALRIRDEPAWYYLCAAYTEGRYGFHPDGQPRLGLNAGLACGRGIGFLERRMPRPIILPAALEQIIEMWERDRRLDRVLSSRALAKTHGFDRRTVRKRLRGAA